MKIIKKINSPIMSTFVKNGFPKLKLTAVKYESGKMEVEAVWMKKEKYNFESNQYVTHKQLDEKLSHFPTHEQLDEKLSHFPTHEQLDEKLSHFPTREELDEKLSHFPTREELDEKLSHFVTKKEFANFRAEMNAQFNELKQLIINK